MKIEVHCQCTLTNIKEYKKPPLMKNNNINFHISTNHLSRKEVLAKLQNIIG